MVVYGSILIASSLPEPNLPDSPAVVEVKHAARVLK